MVLPIIGIPLWLVLLACFMAFVVWYSWDMSKDLNIFERMGIPGPPPMPITGNFGLSYWWNGMFKSQVDTYQQFKNKKFYGTFDAKTPVLNVADSDAIRQILMEKSDHFDDRPNRFHGDPLVNNCLYALKNRRWIETKHAFHLILNSQIMDFALSVIQKSSDTFMNFLRPKIDWRRKVELTRLVDSYVIDVHSNYAFGKDFKIFENSYGSMECYSDKLMSKSKRWRIVSVFFPFASSILRMIRVRVFPISALRYFERGISAILESMNNNNSIDNKKRICFITSLATNCFEESTPIKSDRISNDPSEEKLKEHFQTEDVLKDIPKFSEPEINAHVVTFMEAGLQKVSTIMALTLFQLSNNPTCCEKVQSEIDDNVGKLTPNEEIVQNLHYLDQCICETIRMFPPFASIDRICTKSINLQGVDIPINMIVRIPVYALHNDPDIWTDPKTFDPERFDTCLQSRIASSVFIPFGNGPRSCVGMRFAMTEMKIALVKFLRTVTPTPCPRTKYPVKIQSWKSAPEDDLWVKVRPRFW